MLIFMYLNRVFVLKNKLNLHHKFQIKMTNKLPFRIASVIMLLHALGHTMGTFGWKKTTDATKQSVIDQMLNHNFPFMGANHSFADAMDGYGFIGIFDLLFVAFMLWIIPKLQNGNISIAKWIAVVLGLKLIISGVLEYIYFFPLAAIMTTIAGVLTLYGYSTLSRNK
jgi:ABC-type multidrug transport system permease subunit